MPSVGPLELIIILVIVLLIFGPKRLPGLGRQLGSGLRRRLIACVALFVVAFAVCYSQNDKILEWINKPLENSQKSGSGNDSLEQAAAFDAALEKLLIKLKPALSDTSGALSDLGDEP